MAHVAFYFATSITLAIIITTTLRSNHHHKPTTQPINHHHLSLNASLSLQSNGFNLISALLHISPQIFLSTPNSTIFALPDSAINSPSLSPNILKQLLSYHTSPSNLPFQELFKKPMNSCLPTLVHEKHIAVTKKDEQSKVLEINNVLVSHPDLVLEGPFSIHGVTGPFFSLLNNQENWEIVQLPVCEANYSESSVSRSFSHSTVEVEESKLKTLNKAEWGRIVRLLSSTGFVPFAIGLHSTVERILRDFGDLKSVTILAPPNVALMAMPSPLLDRFVRFHIIPQRLSFEHLVCLPEKASLMTLVSDKHLVITGTVNTFSQILAINGVEITAPDLFSSKKFIIHGIAREFSMDELPSVFK